MKFVKKSSRINQGFRGDATSVQTNPAHFSPIHYGHLICAERTRQVKGLDLVLFLTCGNPPNKAGVLDAEVRHEMVVATVSDNPQFEASRISIKQKGVGYTLMAVEQVKKQYGDDVNLFYLTSS